MTPPSNDRRLARDVAKHLDRRRLRRKLLLVALLIAAIVLAFTRLSCGHGFGFGSGGAGSGTSDNPPTAPRAPRCAIRISATGLTVDGKPATRNRAIAICRAAHGAEVIVTGDARQGDWDDLRAAFNAASIPIVSVAR